MQASTSIEGTFVRTLTIRDNHGNAGLAISPDGTRLVVSNEAEHTIAVYSLPDCVFLTEFGGEGSAPGQFKYPMKICVSPLMGGNMFITDGGGNNRVQVRSLLFVPLSITSLGPSAGNDPGRCSREDDRGWCD